jgi:sugar phosphate isomerase/epimerase
MLLSVVSAALPIGSAAAAPLGLPVGLQLYTVQDAIGRDFNGALSAVAAMGYTAVETNLSLAGRDARQLRAAFDALGLAWSSAHCGGDELLSRLDRTIEMAHSVGLKYIVCPFPPIPGSFRQAIAGIGLDDWKANADLFNRVGAATRQAGIQFCYHNHNLEFSRYGDTTGYDALLRLTDTELVKLELDCGWMVSAGVDPAHYLTRWPERYVMLHVKDLKPDHIPNTDLKMAGTEVGSGIVDWKRIFGAAGKTAVRAYFVEQEPPFASSSLESARISCDYLRRLTI